MTEAPKSRFNWGTALGISLGLFALLMAGFLIRALQEDSNLSGGNTYEQGIRYDQKRAQLQAGERNPITVRQHGDTLRLEGKAGYAGVLTFFRPDGTTPDVQAPFTLDSVGIFDVSVSGLVQGRWQVKLTYKANSESCYAEHSIFLQ